MSGGLDVGGGGRLSGKASLGKASAQAEAHGGASAGASASVAAGAAAHAGAKAGAQAGAEVAGAHASGELDLGGRARLSGKASVGKGSYQAKVHGGASASASGNLRDGVRAGASAHGEVATDTRITGTHGSINAHAADAHGNRGQASEQAEVGNYSDTSHARGRASAPGTYGLGGGFKARGGLEGEAGRAVSIDGARADGQARAEALGGLWTAQGSAAVGDMSGSGRAKGRLSAKTDQRLGGLIGKTQATGKAEGLLNLKFGGAQGNAKSQLTIADWLPTVDLAAEATTGAASGDILGRGSVATTVSWNPLSGAPPYPY